MADLLTHVLVAYILATLCSFRYDWITPRMVTIAMMGALIPDMSRLSLLIDGERVSELLGIPFTWFGFHTVGGAFLAIFVGVVLARHEYRKRVFLLLTLGVVSHLLLDAFLYKPSGVTAPMFWPFLTNGQPIPGLYLSTDRWPAIVSVIGAAGTWYVRYRLR